MTASADCTLRALLEQPRAAYLHGPCLSTWRRTCVTDSAIVVPRIGIARPPRRRWRLPEDFRTADGGAG